MRDLTLNVQETTAVMKYTVEMYQDIGGQEYEVAISMEAGQKVYVLGHFTSEKMMSGKAYIIFDGVKTITVCLSLLDLN